MKYLMFLFFFPSFVFACSSVKQNNERLAFAKVLNPAKTPQKVEAIGIFVPDSVGDAIASSLRVAFFNGENLMLQTSIGVEQVEDGDEEIYKESNIQGYSVAFIYIDMKQLENVHLTVSYRYPPTENGGMIMCGPYRNHKLSELIKL